MNKDLTYEEKKWRPSCASRIWPIRKRKSPTLILRRSSMMTRWCFAATVTATVTVTETVAVTVTVTVTVTVMVNVTKRKWPTLWFWGASQRWPDDITSTSTSIAVRVCLSANASCAAPAASATAKETYKRDCILQNRPLIINSLSFNFVSRLLSLWGGWD